MNRETTDNVVSKVSEFLNRLDASPVLSTPASYASPIYVKGCGLYVGNSSNN